MDKIRCWIAVAVVCVSDYCVVCVFLYLPSERGIHIYLIRGYLIYNMEVECVYEGGVLRPIKKKKMREEDVMEFKEGERVKIILKQFSLGKLRGKYGKGRMITGEVLLKAKDEFYDRRTHIH
ncbi:MAG: hypothetical protein B6U72_07020 [Candidatus Altiarchaeales archaeon ex4484_2]|nr:MAG: hypothetical protein B6U72_07020 [Candidatus Altiarchaeales archaeon ex4484_2]